ncbi:transcription termination/antitermination protein NusG [bacterium]|nr:MAG: transcription termination/antitermination protein NusG [bacterium]
MTDEEKIDSQENVDIAEPAPEQPDAQWYVVHTLTGQEDKVKTYIENTLVDKKLDDKIFEVMVPTEDVIEMRHGKRKTVPRKFFPGYIIVRMVLNKDTEAFIRGVPGVTSFVTSGGNPVPLSEEEIESIMQKTQKEKMAQKVEIPFSEGDPVRVIDGPFKDFTGVVSEINQERGKVRVMVSIFGRLTPVDVDFMQLKPDKK